LSGIGEHWWPTEGTEGTEQALTRRNGVTEGYLSGSSPWAPADAGPAIGRAVVIDCSPDTRATRAKVSVARVSGEQSIATPRKRGGIGAPS